MKEKYQVSWSPKAKESYIEALLFILEKWTIKEVEGFVSKQTSLIYRVINKSIEIVAFIDNRSKHNY